LNREVLPPRDRFPVDALPVDAWMEKRTDQRYPVEEAAVMRIEGVTGGVYVVTVLDVSRFGLRVSCPVGWPLGTRVKVACHGAEVAGEVRYARDVEPDGYHLGIRADKVSHAGQVQDGEIDVTAIFRLRGHPREKASELGHQ
jgi:hypothetical protein